MQKSAIVKGSAQTAPSSRTGGKGKAAGNIFKTAKPKTQFTEILGQLASSMQPMQPVNAGLIKPSGNAAADTTGLNRVKASPAHADGVALKGKMSGAAAGQIESGSTRITHQPAQHAEKANAAETAGAGATQAFTHQLANSNHLPPAREKTSGTGKSDRLSTTARGSGEMRPAVLPAEVSQSSNSGEIKVADLMSRSRVKSPAHGSDRAVGPKSDLALEGFSSGKSGTSSSSGSEEIKAADSMASSRVKSPAHGSDRAVGPKPDLATEAFSAEKSGRSDSLAVKPGETTRSPSLESGSEATGKQTPVNKVEISLNAGGNGLVKTEAAAEPNVMNAGKTMLSQSQTDYLVSKMIQQINVAPSSLEVSLKPEYLGKVSILIHALEGAVAVNVIAHNAEAANLLNSNLHHIRNNLEQQGINVQQMEVNLAFQEKQDHHQGGGYKGERRIVQETASLDTGMDYGSIPYPEQGSTSSYQLNLLA
ncbi:MAG: flagellar hook-length control protein FliK [Syntrophomonadaceae bacterium]|nr:flagellar hook-length control protein FliK [Syntrophomonadaceae bacterium]